MAKKDDDQAKKDQAQSDSDQAQDSDQDSDKKPETDSQGHKLTNEEIREKNIKYSDDDINKGIKLLKTRGYFTKHDFKKMDDNVWAHGFERHIDAKVQNDVKWNPYLYVEKFDFKSGDIDSIIFDMDKVKSRGDALKILAKVLKEKIIR